MQCYASATVDRDTPLIEFTSYPVCIILVPGSRCNHFPSLSVTAFTKIIVIKVSRDQNCKGL